MLRRGYVEVLFKTADEPLGFELDHAIARYSGVHLIAFATSDARAEQARLVTSGFRVRPIAELKRPIATIDGEAEASFTVARVEPGEMREGRMQFLTHHSEPEVWQTRWLAHENGVQALVDVVMAVADVAEASARYERFLGRKATATAVGQGFLLDRGGVQLIDRADFERLLGLKCPGLPFIGCYALRVRSLTAIETILARGYIAATRCDHLLVAPFPAALGAGAWIFTEKDDDLPWRRAPS